MPESERQGREGLDEATERSVLLFFARLYLALGVPAASMVLLHALWGGHHSLFALAQAAFVAAVALGVWLWRERPDRLRPTLTWGLTLISLAGLFHFGPNFGAALVLAANMMLAVFFYGLRGGAVVAGLALAALVVDATWLRSLSASRPPTVPESALGWLRLGATTLVTLGAIAGGFHAAIRALQRSVVAETEALDRAQHAERDRERALEAYAASQRLEAVGRLAGGVSHDVNNALTIVRSGATALRETELSREEQSEILNDIDSAVQAAGATTRQLVAYARGLPTDGGPCSPADVVEAVARALSRMFPDDVEVVVQAHPCRRTAMSEGVLTQVLLNLALNARDACPAGGQVTMSCRESDDGIWVSVRDNGTGMDDVTRRQMFEPFFTTKKGTGTGMGLPMVQAAVTQCDGAIKVETEPERGTTVSVVLPHAPVVVEAPPQDRAPESSPGSRVLLVEDQPLVLRAMTRELRGGGYVVFPVASLRDARRALEASRFDLICTDGVLTDGRAHDVIEALLACGGSDVPVLVCSGYLPDELSLDALPVKYSFVRKPYDPGELLKIADGLVQQSRPV